MKRTIIAAILGIVASVLSASGQGCSAPPSGLVSMWSAEGNASDSVGTQHGTLQNGTAFGSGKVGQSFSFDGTDDAVRVPASAVLNVGTGGGLTLEFWMKPAKQTISPLVEWNNGNTWGLHFWQSVDTVVAGDGVRNLFANIRDTSGVAHQINTPSGLVSTNVYQHVALTYDKTSGIAVIYYNGVVAKSQNLGVFTPQTSYDLYFGRRASGSFSSDRYRGLLDELSLYGRALNSNEIMAIYLADNSGKCPPVSGPPTITQQPVGKNIFQGDSVTFSVTATGTQPLTYQWLHEGTALNGATNRQMTLPDAHLSQGGNYFVIVSNAIGSTPSANALLTVMVPECAPAPSGLVAWWQGNNDSSDSVGTNDGVLLEGTTFGQGRVGQAFVFDGINDSVRIPASGTLNVGAGAALTVEFWFNPFVRRISPLLEWNSGSGSIGMHIWHSVDTVTAGDGLGNLYANLTDVNGTSHQINSAGGLISASTWQHAALTYDRVTGVAVIYLNGTAVRTQNLGVFTPQTSYDLYFGRRASGPFSTDILNGLVDEVSLYNRALGPNEIAAIYNAHGAGKCDLALPPTVVSVTPPSQSVNEGQTASFSALATGTVPLSYQWWHGGNPVAGATSSTLVLSNVLFAQAGNYSVLVSNIAGTATSSNVVLDVNRAPIADAGATAALVVAPLNCDGGISLGTVVLDGSDSSDPDGDGLTYAWFHTPPFIPTDIIPFATGVVAVVQLPVGSNHLTLVVSDGMASSSQSFVVEVITTDVAVERLMAVVQADADRPQSLIASLRAALASIDRCQPEVAINQLEAFKNKVLAQVAPSDPDLANLLLAEAQAFIDILNGGTAAPATALEITAISQNNNGKPHLKIRGAAGRVHIIETSTDMVNWVKVGVAGCKGGCDYEFNDTQTPEAGARFYRIVSPR